MKLILITLGVVLIGCAQKPIVAPSGVGTSSAISRTGVSVAEARKYNDLAVVHNKNAMTRVQRIEAKSQVIQRFWNSSGK